jgi:hypothetical protein
MTEKQTTTVPKSWLVAVVHLLDQMTYEGLSMVDCEDPADLMCEIAVHLGVGDADDMWKAAVEKLADD